MHRAPTVLLVTAVPVMAEVYTRHFERAGWEVTVVGNLLDAERKAVRLRPTVLLIDASVTEGVVAELKRLKRLPTLLKTHKVLFAKHATHAFVHDALDAGAEDVILTPHITPRAVVTRIVEHTQT